MHALLSHNIQWLKDDGKEDGVATEGVGGRGGPSTMSVAKGRWIYSLLACLDPLVGATVAASLRDLCRSCVAIKKDKARDSSGTGAGICKDDREGARVIATIIAAYFGQLDLLPEASSPAPAAR